MRQYEIFISKLTWSKAVELAIVTGKICGVKQKVYKDRFRGWTWRDCDGSYDPTEEW